jgi:signal transduction histidine kinase
MRHSLTLRLALTSSLWVTVTLLGTAVLLVLLFRAHIERRFDAGLYDHMQELVAASEAAADGSLTLSWTPADPRFNRPHSGWYWQIGGSGEPIARSASLWRSHLPVPTDSTGTEPQRRAMIGPEGEGLRALLQTITFPESESAFIFLVAGPSSDVDRDVGAFTVTLAATLGTLGLGLLGAILLQVRFGLRPLRALQRALGDIRAGRAARLPETFPAEVQPVVAELNALIAHNAALLQRARTQASNLAHALRNPLTVIRNEAASLGGERGDILREQAAAMGASIERHLSRARLAGPGGGLRRRTLVSPIAEDLRFSMERLYRNRSLRIVVVGLEHCCFAGDAEDLEEMLGTLVDNACKWARTEVRIRGDCTAQRLSIAVEDDGPGIPAAQRAEVLKRGSRLDEAVPGSGLGLSIAAEIAELYRGSVRLEDSPLGGTRAVLDLPTIAEAAYALA